jgi:uncharacterized protein YbgA (DUF1722 family)/uncharacterized protein YbbK (DUF523 family)
VTSEPLPPRRPRLGISACLIGDEVRFDGGHKRDAFLTEVLGPHVEWVRVCPEVEIGMGTPRETLRLERGEGGTVRMVTTRTGVDYTDAMREWSRARLEWLAAENLSGYVLKKDSPSCGMERVKVYGGGMPVRAGRGIFADELLTRFPGLPVEEEGRLSDPRLRENFIQRVFAYQRLRGFFAGKWTLGSLVAFHTAEKMSLLAHSRVAYDALGRMLATASGLPRAQLREEYELAFMQALAVPATRGRHANVLMHMAGHLKKHVEDDDRRELAECIEQYRAGLVPLVVPLTLLRHHIRKHRIAYLAGQTYLDPHPAELMLRNHV